MTENRRPSTQPRKHNSLAAACPPAIFDKLIQRKVQKGGSVTLSADLQRGVKATVARVNETTFVVSTGPISQIQAILEDLPKSTPSPFAALSERLRGQKHEIATSRSRPAFIAGTAVPDLSDEEAMRDAITERSSRTR
jgi:hypothetical protein